MRGRRASTATSPRTHSLSGLPWISFSSLGHEGEPGSRHSAAISTPRRRSALAAVAFLPPGIVEMARSLPRSAHHDAPHARGYPMKTQALLLSLALAATTLTSCLISVDS